MHMTIVSKERSACKGVRQKESPGWRLKAAGLLNQALQERMCERRSLPRLVSGRYENMGWHRAHFSLSVKKAASVSSASRPSLYMRVTRAGRNKKSRLKISLKSLFVA
jgi:hypothetical protein